MNDNIKFEIKADAFQRMTGMLPPGKDDRSGSYSYEERRDTYARWIDENGAVIETILQSVDANIEFIR